MDKNYYKSIIEHSPVGCAYHKIIYDGCGISTDYQFVEVNKSFESMIGIDSKDLIGKRVSQINKSIEKGQSNWSDFYGNIKNNYTNREFEYYFDFIDKHYRVNIHCPRKDYIMIYFTDITREIQEKDKLNLLSDNISTQIWYLIDPATYGSVNKAHADFLGYRKKDIQFKNIHDFLSPEEARICIEGNKQVFREKKPISVEEWIVNASGEKRLLKTFKNPKFNSQGEVELVICSAEDITQEKQYEEEKNIRERILYSMIDFTQELLTNNDPDDALANGIAMLGEAAKVDRVYYWENHYDNASQRMMTSHKLEWCLDDIEPQIDNQELQNVPFEESIDFIGTLAQNKPFKCHIKDMADGVNHTKQVLADQGILSILAIPVFVGDEFRGFMGFDSCKSEKNWSEVEISLLNSFILLYTKSIEKKELEEHVIQVKENFDNFFNMVQDSLFVLGLKGDIIYVNDTALDKFNYSREDLIGEPVWTLHHRKKQQEVRAKLQDFMDKNINEFHIPAITKDGYVFEVETRITEGIWDGKKVIFAVCKDISLLRRSERKFSKAFNNSGVSMFISTFDRGELIEVNDKFLNKIGYERSEIIGRPSLDLNIFKNFENRQLIKKMIKSQKNVSELETKIICKDGTIRTGLCNIVSLEINYQKCLLVSFIDMTDRNIMVEELAKAKKQSDIANYEKSKFLSNMSHEIRTPMNAVIGYSELLSYTKLSTKQEDYLRGVKASSQMLMMILNDILDWSKIEDCKVELENIVFNIDEVIYNVVEQIKFITISREVEILVEKEETIPYILYGDPLRLQQVLLNLLSNSIKFTEVGEIKVTVKLIKAKTNKATLQFEVSDTGIGIDSDHIKDIFSPFKQSNNEKANTYSGTGLGLSICKNIVELMDGSIWVESVINKGSTFYFTADFYIKDSNDRISDRQYEDLCVGKNIDLVDSLLDKKVLVVDDNEINQYVLKEILKGVGVIVTTCSSGLEAIEWVKRQDYDIVLMDIRMPGMDGYEAAAEIRKIKTSKELSIIAVTASASPDERERCILADIDDCIFKPIERKKLFKAMLHSTNKKPGIDKKLNKPSQKKKDSLFDRKDKKYTGLSFEINGINLKEALDHLNGNKELLIKILKKFKRNHFNVIQKIKEALSNGSIELAIRLAHTIKGVSGELMAKEIHSISGDIELKLIKGDFDIRKQLLELASKLENLFASSLFEEKEEDKSKSIVLKQVDIVRVNPVLNKLEALLLESDIDSIQYIEKLENLTKATTIRKQVIQIKDYGDRYDFENALQVVKKIKSNLKLGDG